MPRKSPRLITSLIRKLVSSLFPESSPSRPSHNSQRRLKFEPLEGRALLAADLATITGIVSFHTPIEGATVNIYEDDGDGIFEPGDGDSLIDNGTTDINGRYTFGRLTAGNYFVEQPAQTAGMIDLGQVTRLVSVSALQAGGTAGTVIDTFADPQQSITVDTSGTTGTPSANHVGALGGERDLAASLVDGQAGDMLVFDSQLGRLQFTSTVDAVGQFVAKWDGDNDGAANNFEGLDYDLTDGGSSEFLRLRARANASGATLTIKVWSDATHSSTTTVAIPGSDTDVDFAVAFADFIAGGGGAATFNDVGMIELIVDTTVSGTDGQVSILGAYGDTVVTQDFDNEADLSLTKVKDIASPNVGDLVEFTITLSNAAGGVTATNIEVTDLLPSGLEFDSKNVPAGTTYDEVTTGVWSVGSLAPGSQAVLKIVARVTSSAAITNTAEITGVDQPDPNSTPDNQLGTEDDQASLTIDAPNAADLSLTKSVSDDTPLVGQQITFTLTLSNTGPDQATGIVVTDLLPAGLTFVSASQPTDYDDESGLWTVDSLDADDEVTLEIIATVAASGTIINNAEVTDVDQHDPDSTPDDGEGDDFASESLTVPPQADLSLSKTKDIVSPNVGDEIEFTITVSNDGPEGATGIVVTDLLPAGLEFVSKNPAAGTTYNELTGIWTIGALSADADVVLEIVARLTSSAVVTNTAEITAAVADDDDSTPNNHLDTEDDQASITIDAAPASDLRLTLEKDIASPNVGQLITFTITVFNDGPDQATNVDVKSLLPAGLSHQSNDPEQGTYDSVSGIWDVGSIASGASLELEIVARLDSSAQLTTTAEVFASDQFDPDSTVNNNAASEDDQASIAIDAPAAADLSITNVPSNLTPNFGTNVNFVITVTNNGPDAATGVTVADTLAAALTFQSASTATGTFDDTSKVWTIPTIASGASVQLTVTARVDTTAAVTNTAQVTASDVFDPDSTPNDGAGDDFATASVDAPAAADLSITNVPSSATPNFGTNVNFVITVTNNGPDAATGVTVADTLATGLTFQSASTATGTFDDTSKVWTIPTIASGESVQLTVTARVDTTAAVTNTAQVTASAVFDPDSTPNDGAGDDFASASVDAPAAADLSITNVPSSATPNFGTNVNFVITVTNNGPDAATGVTVADTLGTGLTFVSGTTATGTFDSNTKVWTIPTIASGASVQLTVTARVDTTAAVTNTAQVTASAVFDPDSTPNNGSEDDFATASVDAPAAADLRLSKSANLARPAVGQNVTFTLTLTNDGPDQATGVTVADTLPAGLTFVSATTATGTFDSTTRVWTVPTLNSGAAATLQIVAQVTATGSKTNVAQVTASGQFDPDSTPNDNTGDDRATVELNAQRLSKRRFLAR